ncbi:MAG: hypothetical protein KKF00_10440, partial [Proteobacteria bacterium]|nr:hypothetical protein [Pseudomonadota bacterium]
MEKFKSFLKTSILGGVVVILPMFIFIMVFKWLFGWVTDIIHPLTDFIVIKANMSKIIADALVIA